MNSRKAVHVYALSAKIRSFLISVSKYLKTDWERAELVDLLHSYKTEQT